MPVVIAILIAFAVSGCAIFQPEVTATTSGACQAMKPHFPEKVSRNDTDMTKRAAFRRNVAFDAACKGN